MNEQTFFQPTEIIFATTGSCNLKCSCCFVSKNPVRIDIQEAKAFLKSTKNSPNCTIEKIGFSGGEPFLYMEFLEEIIKESVAQDFLFDRIMTNGVWWNSEDELNEKLQKIYDAGFDGKIGLSYDYFHGQDFEKIEKFIDSVLKIFGPQSLEIQSVVPFDTCDTDFVKKADVRILKDFKLLSEKLGCSLKKYTKPFSKTGLFVIQGGKSGSKKGSKNGSGLTISQPEEICIRIFRTPETFPCSDGRGWKSKKWFKEDFCAGPGQILYVHSSGKIAPCCGFANENSRLILGNIKQGYDEIVLNGEANPLVKTCFQTGLLEVAKKLQKEGKLNRKTQDPCTFCDYVCKYELV